MTKMLKWSQVVLFIAYCMWAAVSNFQQTSPVDITSGPGRTDQDRFFGRFAEARRHLAGTKRAGYVRVGLSDGSMFPAAYFYLAQYALVPTQLSPTADHRYVIGDFGTKELREAYLSRKHLVVLQDFDNGLVLLENPRIQ